MDQGFPGEFNITVTYSLDNDNNLKIKYIGTSNKDTIANMTNHSYFNLSGHNSGTAMEHKLYINADKYVEVDDELIPTGELRDVSNTPMDFRTPTKIGLRINEDFKQFEYTGGYDHSFVINKTNNGIEKIAVLSDESSGRTMEVYTDSIGVQFYAGNFIENNKVIGKENCSYKNRSGVCLETGRHTVIFHTRKETFSVPGSLSRFADAFADTKNFLSCGRSYLVNLDFVDGFLNQALIMSDNSLIPVPIRKQSETARIIEEYKNSLAKPTVTF